MRFAADPTGTKIGAEDLNATGGILERWRTADAVDHALATNLPEAAASERAPLRTGAESSR
jgi:hypothetical protein